MSGPDFRFGRITRPEDTVQPKLRWEDLRALPCRYCGGELVDGVEVEGRMVWGPGVNTDTAWWHVDCPETAQ